MFIYNVHMLGLLGCACIVDVFTMCIYTADCVVCSVVRMSRCASLTVCVCVCGSRKRVC